MKVRRDGNQKSLEGERRWRSKKARREMEGKSQEGERRKEGEEDEGKEQQRESLRGEKSGRRVNH